MGRSLPQAFSINTFLLWASVIPNAIASPCNCINDPPSWHASNGSTYDCSWYAQGTNCIDWGNYDGKNKFGNNKFNKSANEACCVCGGGSCESDVCDLSSYSSSSQAPSSSQTSLLRPSTCSSISPAPPSSSQTSSRRPSIRSSISPAPPSSAPTTSIFSSVDSTSSPNCTCVNTPGGWYDRKGFTYNCAWYAEGTDNCEKWGNGTKHFGKTANEACCVCGGGVCAASSATTATYIPGLLDQVQNGVTLSHGLTARIIAKSGCKVQLENGMKSTSAFHLYPDGAAVIKDANGSGYAYVSNSEVPAGKGGVGALYFNKDGNVVDYKMLLTGTNDSCSGGLTPYNTYISCEEDKETRGGGRGRIWEIDPYKETARVTVIGSYMGHFEAAAYDDSDPDSDLVFYITEDSRKGPLVQFTPNSTTLQMAKRTGNYEDVLHTQGTERWLILIPSSGVFSNTGSFRWTTNRIEAQNAVKGTYPNAEGLEVINGMLYFTIKKRKELFVLDLRNKTYKKQSTVSGTFTSTPDQIQGLVKDDQELVYFVEEGDVSGLHALDKSGRFYTVLESSTIRGGTSGIAFRPDNVCFYLAYQRAGLIYEVCREDGLSFGVRNFNVRYHSQEDEL